MFPFGKWRNFSYQDVFTGFVFYRPLEEHISELGIPGLGDDFKDVYLSRVKCTSDGDSFSSDSFIGKLQNKFFGIPGNGRQPIDYGFFRTFLEIAAMLIFFPTGLLAGIIVYVRKIR